MEIKDLTLDREGLIEAIACEDAAFDEQLRAQAYRTKIATVGEKVYLRGLIEISNICVKNCLYCGIRHDINIAAATSLEALSDNGRVKGIHSGANVIMPNVTPEEQMIKYNLYDRKTLVRDGTLKVTLPDDIAVGYGAWGDSLHFKR
ncbi:MAG: hypothetical protein IKO77_01340 [Bacteroidales bacterium]|nr:hypothetical protein [Bacteroidales bacterium]